MLEQLILSKEMNDVLVNLSNKDDELTGFILGERTEKGIEVNAIYLAEGTFASTRLKAKLPHRLQQEIEKDPTKYCAGFLHIHSRTYGDTIQYEPYWTLGKNDGDKAGTIVDGRFIINSHQIGDDRALETFSQILGINYALFVHPEWGSEGQIMSRDKVRATGYKYAPSNVGKVTEIPVLIQ